MKKINFLGIIPARSGSQTIKNKNIKYLNGKPLIYWTIKAAQNSKYLKDFIVSTNSKKISKISKCYGANVPFLRPNSLAKSDSTMLSVIKHLLLNVRNIDKFYAIVLLPPTAPLRTAKDIDMACKLFIKNKPDSLIGVTELKHTSNPDSLYTIADDYRMKFVNKGEKIYLKQKKKIFFTSNSSIYITKTQKAKDYIIGGKLFGYVMPMLRSIDIDTKEELLLANLIMKNNNN